MTTVKRRRPRARKFDRTTQKKFRALLRLCGLSRPELATALGVSTDTVQAWSTGRERISPAREELLLEILEEQKAQAEELVASGADVVIPGDDIHSDNWWEAVAARVLAVDPHRLVRARDDLSPAAAHLEWVLNRDGITEATHPVQVRLKHHRSRREMIAAAPAHRRDLLERMLTASGKDLDGHETRITRLPAAKPDETWPAWLETQASQFSPDWDPFEVLTGSNPTRD